AYQLASQTGAVRAALVEVPRPGALAGPLPSETVCVRGRLANTHHWRIETPSFLLLENGKVTRATITLDGLRRALEGPPTVVTAEGGFLSPDYRKIRREMYLREIACGPLALVRLLQEFDLPLAEDEADRLLAEAGDKGIDLLRLKELAE